MDGHQQVEEAPKSKNWKKDRPSAVAVAVVAEWAALDGRRKRPALRTETVAWPEAEWCPILMDTRGRTLERRMDSTGLRNNAEQLPAAVATERATADAQSVT